jgi:antitoxin VapB
MKTAKLFASGRSQAVRLPKECRFEGTEVLVRRFGRAVVLFPADEPWQPLLNSLDQFTDDFMADRAQPPAQLRESL